MAELFQVLKQALVQAPVLALPDFTVQFIRETDACDTRVGDVLMQKGHPIAFLSKGLGIKNRALSLYDKECLAILMVVDKWKAYLQVGEVNIYTDERSLVQLGDHHVTTPMQQKAFFRLMGLQYQIVYKQGKANLIADALSHRLSNCTVSCQCSRVGWKLSWRVMIRIMWLRSYWLSWLCIVQMSKAILAYMGSFDWMAKFSWARTRKLMMLFFRLCITVQLADIGGSRQHIKECTTCFLGQG